MTSFSTAIPTELMIIFCSTSSSPTMLMRFARSGYWLMVTSSLSGSFLSMSMSERFGWAVAICSAIVLVFRKIIFSFSYGLMNSSR